MWNTVYCVVKCSHFNGWWFVPLCHPSAVFKSFASFDPQFNVPCMRVARCTNRKNVFWRREVSNDRRTLKFGHLCSQVDVRIHFKANGETRQHWNNSPYLLHLRTYCSRRIRGRLNFRRNSSSETVFTLATKCFIYSWPVAVFCIQVA